MPTPAQKRVPSPRRRASRPVIEPKSGVSSQKGGAPSIRSGTPPRVPFGGANSSRSGTPHRSPASTPKASPRRARSQSSVNGGRPSKRTSSSTAVPALPCDAAAPATPLSDPTTLPAPSTPGAAQSLGVGLDTFRALRELEQREIEPEDYDLLSRLHTGSSAVCVLTAGEVETRLPAFSLLADEASECLVCMGAMTKSERVRRLPCSGRHVFHEACIREWLTRSSPCCPADREDVRKG